MKERGRGEGGRKMRWDAEDGFMSGETLRAGQSETTL